jgi:hypothetical protein
MEERCNHFAANGKRDPNWAFSYIVRFLQYQKERVEREEITGATLRNFVNIIPQNWASIFPHILNNIHHPDNLYLTCARCNSQLGDNFPKTELRNMIVTKYGTIGDWIRQFEKEIR